MKYLLGVDIGGGSIRCCLYNIDKKEIFIEKNQYRQNTIYNVGEFGQGIDTEKIWNSIKDIILKTIANSKCNKDDIKALSITTFRHSMVAIDSQGKVLYATSNRDARAVDETMKLNDTIANDIYKISGHKPMPNLMACKIMYLKDKCQDIYSSTETIFTLADYLNYRITGKMYSEITQAAESMLFDLEKRSWSEIILSKLNIDNKLFPKLINSGEVIGAINKEIAKELGISENTIVVSAAADTQSALLGLSALEVGETGVVAGTTAPIQMIVDKPYIDAKGRIWTGVAALPNKYVIESNGGGMGNSMEWIAGVLYSDHPDPIRAVMAAATKSKVGAGGAISTIGADIFNNSVLSLPIDQLLFSSINHTPCVDDKYKISRSVLEGMAFAVKGNVEQLEEVSGILIDKIYVGGGMSANKKWKEIISDVTNVPVVSIRYNEATIFGAIICAATGAGFYKTLDQASKAINIHNEVIENMNNSYERIYDDWKEMYFSSFESNMSLGALINELRSEEKENTISSDTNIALKIYVDADLSEQSIEKLEEFGSVTFNNYRDGDMLEGEEMIETLKDYDVFITEVDIVDADIVKKLSNIKMIGVCRGNPTNIDIDACSAAGIPVVYTPGRNADAVADLTIALMLNMIRMIQQSSTFMKEEGGEAGDLGRMGAAYFRYQGLELWNTTVGIIGGGAIGKKVAKRLLGFESKLLVYDPYLSEEDAILMGAELVDLDYLLRNSDIITLHAPVTESTKNMISKTQFDIMKEGVYFINTARAALVDYDALLDALNSGKIKGAGLDVYPIEPPAWNDPLLQKDNVICTPHIAGNTLQVSIHQGIIIADNIRNLLRRIMTSDVINRDKIKAFSFDEDRVFDSSVLDNLSNKAIGVSDLDKDKDSTITKDNEPIVNKFEKEKSPNQGGYMSLIKEFLSYLSSDDEVKQKTKNKDISFQITFKDNDESCYMYFKEGEVLCDLGEFPYGTAEVNLKMPVEIFDGMMKGTVNGAKAAMTGKMSFTGNVRKAMSMQSILKLMMSAYSKAIDKIGNVDKLTNMNNSQSATSQQNVQGHSNPVNNNEVAVYAEKKKGIFKNLFKRRSSEAALQVTEKVIYMTSQQKPKTNDIRDEIMEITNEMYIKGLLTGIGGNISARCEDNPNHIWITPSSVFKGDLSAEMMVRIDLKGNNVGNNDLSASSEKMVHLGIYKKRPEVMAIIHSHASYSTIMALTGMKFKPISSDAAFIGDIPVVPYLMPGSPELGDIVGEAIGEDKAAVIMQNHGLVVAGNSVRRAADVTEVIEVTAKKIIECNILGIEPQLIPEDALEELESIGKMII